MFRPRTAWLGHVISFLLLVPTSVFAQTDRGQPSVSGCVQDPSQAAIRGAAVSVAGQSESLRRQAQTNDKGCFALYDVSDGMYNLRILAEGFSPHEQVIRVGKDPVKIDSVTLELRPVQTTTVVTATRGLVSSSDTPSSVDVIDANQIDASHLQGASDLLRSVAAVNVVRTGTRGGITSLFTRGGESDYTKILIDGIPVNQPGGAYDISHIPTDNIGRVEVVRGPQSALFGSDAMTGVIQMFSRPGSGSPEGDYSVETGNYGTLKQGAGLRGSWKKFDWSITFSRLDTDNIKPNNDYRNASYFGNFGFTPDSRQTLRGTVFHISSRVGSPGVNAPGFTSFGPNDHAEGMERAVGITYRILATSRIAQQFAFRNYDHDYSFFSTFGVSPSAHTRRRGEYQGEIALPFGGFSYGIDFDREMGEVGGKDHLRNNAGYYVQQQVEVWDRLKVTGGVRIEDDTTFGVSTNPKAGVSLRVAPRTRVRFSAGTAIKEPNFTENFSTNSYFLGNADLLPERSKSWEAGIEQSFAGDRVKADLAWFDNRFRNVIELVSRPDFTGVYQNIGRSIARGLELRTRARIRQLLLQGDYTYLNGKIQESTQTSFPFRPGDPLLRRPKHSGDVTLTWTDRKWTARWSTRAIGRRADSDFFTYSTPLTSNAGYSVSDAAFTYQFASPVAAFIRVENIFNKNYQEALGYLALRRSFVVGTKLRIGKER